MPCRVTIRTSGEHRMVYSDTANLYPLRFEDRILRPVRLKEVYEDKINQDNNHFDIPVDIDLSLDPLVE